MKASVIIRAKDEADSIGRTLALLGSQEVDEPIETIVVDSESTDRTAKIASDAGAIVIGIAADEFTFGRALNRGCEHAQGDVLIALSAHAFPPDTGWVARVLAAMEDDRLACACGYGTGPTGEPLSEPRRQDLDDLRRFPFWGYTNASGGFRRRLWEQRGFREDMPGTEDKEWAAYWVERGYVTLVDPALAVEHGHHDESLRLTYERSRREWHGFAQYLDLRDYGIGDLARDWWRVDEPGVSPVRLRANPRRCARLIGRLTGQRTGRTVVSTDL